MNTPFVEELIKLSFKVDPDAVKAAESAKRKVRLAELLAKNKARLDAASLKHSKLRGRLLDAGLIGAGAGAGILGYNVYKALKNKRNSYTDSSNTGS